MKFTLGREQGDRVELDVLRYESEEPSDGPTDWIVVETAVSAGGFSGQKPIHCETRDLVDFLSQARELHQSLTGEARFTTIEGELELMLTGDGLGHITVDGVLTRFATCVQRLEFEIEIDQTDLGGTLRDMKDAVAAFPCRVEHAAPSEYQLPRDYSRALLRRIRLLTVGFIVGLIVSGVTAFPLPQEVNLLARWMGIPEGVRLSGFDGWIATVRDGLNATQANYPFLFYGTDWLAFGHLVIAVAFLGVLKDPVRNKWVIQWGLIACAAVIPLALICGPIRGIPFYWQLIDCSFGVVGFVPLAVCLRAVRELELMGAE